jgi:multidrug efflux pump subunit AcrB
VRIIPIAMTSLATVIGLLPAALGIEAGTESNRPLALAVVGGLVSSTLISIFLVPSMFLVIARRPRESSPAVASIAERSLHEQTI